mgnify:CR=1 FL=1
MLSDWKITALGNALNEGIKHCKSELIARMDSDDIAYPDRCEKQLAVFSAHTEVSICSGIVRSSQLIRTPLIRNGCRRRRMRKSWNLQRSAIRLITPV